VKSAVPLLLVLLTLWAAPARAQTGGVDLFSAETLGQDLWRTSLSYVYTRSGHLYRGSHAVGDPRHQLAQEHLLVAGFDYGILPELTVSILVPLSRRELRFRPPGRGTKRQRLVGPGDVSLLARYRVFKTDWKRSAAHIAVVGGVQLPTGIATEREDDVRLPRFVQTGRGTVNPILGLTANLSVDRLRFDARVAYRYQGRGPHDFDPGDRIAAEVDAAYRFLHTQYPGPAGSVKLGVLWTWEGHAKENGHRVRDTGFLRVELKPGLVLHPLPRLDLNLSANVPIYRHVRGFQLARDVRISLAFGIRF
jgi:hypothetical protein